MLVLSLLGDGDNLFQLGDFLIVILDVEFIKVFLGQVSDLGGLLLQHFQAAFKALMDSRSTAGYHALHDNQQKDEAHVLFTISERLVVGLGNICCHQFI